MQYALRATVNTGAAENAFAVCRLLGGYHLLLNRQAHGACVGTVVAVAAFFFIRSKGEDYDMGYFLGLRQIFSQKSHVLLTEDAEFTGKGILGITRHPWYLGSLTLLWSVLPVYHVSTAIAATILSLYLIVGTLLEERKLVAEFGENYQAYQRKVSMLVPWKWLCTMIMRRRH